ncbi:leader peptidase (prepilin peptidase)/N-methyltransferase [Cryobacterium sp. MP_3.1]|uniref:prepilin peptidase n=1 Tax=Cryobacterium sp. MP_3.1 TaxID=3071711 RepID=UPI002E0BBB88|nr:leader peptidase (prepilin peptidase)/N-methyltransferase [Cryobacterium sp. MP_3.1]
MIEPLLASFAVLVTVLSSVLGLAVGSFLNVVVYRVPLGMSVVTPPSSCPRCGAAITSRDNIPVLSWVLLAGKCRSCRTAISVRYPLVEAGTGAAFVAVTLDLISDEPTSGRGITSGLLVLGAYLYLAAVSIALALIDVDVHRLPNLIVLPGYVVGTVLLSLAALSSGDLGPLLRAGIGLAAMWFAYFLMAIVYSGGMGFGDVKLAGVLGLFLGYLGWGELAVGSFAAFLLGGFYAVGLLVARRATRKSGIPFGPWMLAGAWVGIFFGDRVWDGYLTLLGAV